MNRLALASLSALVASSCIWLACSSSTSNPGTGGTDAGGPKSDAGDAGVPSLFALGVPCTDSLDSIYGDPGPLPADNGHILKCAVDTDVSMADLQSKLAANLSTDPVPAMNLGYTGKALTSGAHVYRITYRTERGDDAGTPGYSSAKVFIPDTPRAKGKLPLLVGARGSRGQAASCVASKEDPSAQIVNGDYEALSFPMVGAGLPIVVPDLAGYANYGAAGNPPSSYAGALDTGRSTLDGARAMAKMFPAAFSGKIAIVGHSQGGHSAFASLAIQPQYAPELTVAAVAVYSPLWISQRSWGAILYEPSTFPLVTDPSPTAVSVWYHYTHGELLDGPGHGMDVFQASKQAAIKQFIDHDCWYAGWDGLDAGTVYPELQAVAQTATDLFDPAFVTSIAQPSAGVGKTSCGTDAVCAKWMQRYADDRPHLANTPPILIEYGDQDQTLDPGRMACVVDRLKNQDQVPYSFCLNSGVGHTGVVRQQSSYVADWIASQTMGEAAPAACARTDVNLTDDAGVPIPCTTPPPNN